MSDTNVSSTLHPSENRIPLEDFSAHLEILERENAKALIPTFIYLGILIISGLVGNTVIFVVYFTRYKPSSTRTFILAMGTIDLCSNVLAIPGELTDIKNTYTFDNRPLCRLARFVNSFFTLVSAFILVAVALDRHRKMCNLLTKKQFSMKMVMISIAICVGASLICSVPFAGLNGRQTVKTSLINITGVTCSIDDVFVGTLMPTIWNMVMAVAFIACVVVLIVCYTRIAISLWRHNQRTKVLTDVEDNSSTHAKTRNPSYQLHENSSSDDKSEIGSSRKSSLISTTLCSCEKVVQIKPEPDLTLSKLAEQLSVSVITFDTPDVQHEFDDEGFGSSENDGNSSFSATGGSDNEHPSSHLNETELGPAAATNVPPSSGSHSRIITNSYNARTDLTTEVPSDDHSGIMSHNPILILLTAMKRLTLDKQHESDLKKRQGRKMSTSSVKAIPTRTTLMMFVLTAVFIINFLPHLIIISARGLNDQFGKNFNSGWELNVYNIALRSYFINSAVNPVVYSFCSARFRYECRKLFTCK